MLIDRSDITFDKLSKNITIVDSDSNISKFIEQWIRIRKIGGIGSYINIIPI